MMTYTHDSKLNKTPFLEYIFIIKMTVLQMYLDGSQQHIKIKYK